MDVHIGVSRIILDHRSFNLYLGDLDVRILRQDVHVFHFFRGHYFVPLWHGMATDDARTRVKLLRRELVSILDQC